MAYMESGHDDSRECIRYAYLHTLRLKGRVFSLEATLVPILCRSTVSFASFTNGARTL